jgi:hypothetical protein
MKTIYEMDCVIQNHCNACCDECVIDDLCHSIHGEFTNHENECKEAYERIIGLSEHANDPVNHPSHYTKGKIEVADFIADQKLNFDRGNAVKYVCRAGSKDPEKEIQDLEKAIWYINHEIKTLKGETNNEA